MVIEFEIYLYGRNTNVKLNNLFFVLDVYVFTYLGKFHCFFFYESRRQGRKGKLTIYSNRLYYIV